MPEDITLENFQIAVAAADEGQTLLVLTDTMIPRQYRLTLDPEAAKTIGQALLAPRVAQPPTPKIQLPR